MSRIVTLRRDTLVAQFACYDKSCAPPPAGTGGSKKQGASSGGGGGDRFDQEVEYEQSLRAKRRATEAANPHIVNAWESPHFKKRTAAGVGAMSEADAIKLIEDNDATGRRILAKGVKIGDTQSVGVRANLNVKKTTGITVQTMHQGTSEQLRNGTGMFNGEAIGYGAAPILKNANFSVNQNARAAIASGAKNKFPMASVDGYFQSPDTPNGQRDQVSKFNGVEITFNPMKNHTFVDPDGRAVKAASDVTVVGSKVYARGQIEYYTPENMPRALGGIPTQSVTASAMEFACYDKSCAPPPAGTGGSKKAGSVKALRSLSEPDGGMTLSTNLRPLRSGFAVAVGGSDRLLLAKSAFDADGNPSAKLVGLVRDRIDAVMSMDTPPGTRKALGGWNNPDDGKIEVNMTVVFPKNKEAAAMKFAKDNDQIALFSLHDGEVVMTGGTGGNRDV